MLFAETGRCQSLCDPVAECLSVALLHAITHIEFKAINLALEARL